MVEPTGAGVGPDVIYSNCQSVASWGSIGGIRGYTLGGGFELVPAGVMYEKIPAIAAWHDHRNGINVPDEGRFVAAAKARDNGDELLDYGAVWILFLNANGTVKSKRMPTSRPP